MLSLMSRRSIAASPSASAAVVSGKSLPVTTALTPGVRSAALVSIDTMRAWACGLRRTAPCSMPGQAASAP